MREDLFFINLHEPTSSGSIIIPVSAEPEICRRLLEPASDSPDVMLV
jgi:hypothetical protein